MRIPPPFDQMTTRQWRWIANDVSAVAINVLLAIRLNDPQSLPIIYLAQYGLVEFGFRCSQISQTKIGQCKSYLTNELTAMVQQAFVMSLVVAVSSAALAYASPIIFAAIGSAEVGLAVEILRPYYSVVFLANAKFFIQQFLEVREYKKTLLSVSFLEQAALITAFALESFELKHYVRSYQLANGLAIVLSLPFLIYEFKQLHLVVWQRHLFSEYNYFKQFFKSGIGLLMHHLTEMVRVLGAAYLISLEGPGILLAALPLLLSWNLVSTFMFNNSYDVSLSALTSKFEPDYCLKRNSLKKSFSMLPFFPLILTSCVWIKSDIFLMPFLKKLPTIALPKMQWYATGCLSGLLLEGSRNIFSGFFAADAVIHRSNQSGTNLSKRSLLAIEHGTNFFSLVLLGLPLDYILAQQTSLGVFAFGLMLLASSLITVGVQSYYCIYRLYQEWPSHLIRTSFSLNDDSPKDSRSDIMPISGQKADNYVVAYSV